MGHSLCCVTHTHIAVWPEIAWTLEVTHSTAARLILRIYVAEHRLGPGIGRHVACVTWGVCVCEDEERRVRRSWGLRPQWETELLSPGGKQTCHSPWCQLCSQNRSLFAGKWVMITSQSVQS